jgi:hypothetical protein
VEAGLLLLAEHMGHSRALGRWGFGVPSAILPKPSQGDGDGSMTMLTTSQLQPHI